MTISLEQAKAQCRVLHSREDDLIEQHMNAAKAYLERYTGKLLAVGEAVDTFTAFGDYLELTRGPFVSLTSIAYIDADGAGQTLSGASVRDGRVYAPTDGWPAIQDHSAITVTYQAGYATTPADLDMAQLLLIGHFYSHREAVTVGGSATSAMEIPLGVEALAWPYRLPVLR